MKTLELEKIGVQEISPEQLKKKEGGCLFFGVIVTYVLVEALLNPSAHIQAFKEGMDMAK